MLIRKNGHGRIALDAVCAFSKLKHPKCYKLLHFKSILSYHQQSYLNLLTISSECQSLHQIKQTHAFAIHVGFIPSSVSLSASLLLRYTAFQEPNSSLALFEQAVPFCRTAFLWNTLIRALSLARLHDRFSTYNRMVRTGVRPDDHTFPFVLKTCTDNLELRKGLEIHGCLFKLGFDTNVFVGNTLLLFYGNSGCLKDVKRVFDEMPERDIVSWNSVIGMFSVNGFYEEALDLYSVMNSTCGFKPNSVSMVSVLPVCGGLADEALASLIHCYAVKVSLDVHVTISNALVDVYGKCGNARAAKQVFDEMMERNEVSWNSIITSLAYTNNDTEAFDMFRLMISAGLTPNPVAISSILPVLVKLEYFNTGKEIHGLCLKLGVESDVFIANSLIDMYAKSGHPAEASDVFHNMDTKNVVSWNAMVANLAQNGLEIAALQLVRELPAHNQFPNSVTYTNVVPACARGRFLRSGKEIHARIIHMGLNSDVFLTNALADMYAKCGCLNLAQIIFNMSQKDKISYNTLIVAYSQSIDCSKSLVLFSEMWLLGVKHDVVSFMGVISACANLAATKQGKEIHGAIVRKHFHTHLFVANSLLDFYTRCGRIDVANKIFDRIPNKDTASWNSMILGYGMLGELDTAIKLFEAMKEDGVEYDAVSYIAVLSACSHGGLVEMGKKYFNEMQACSIQPTEMHFACMVDLFGRAGLMKDAVNLIKNLPIEPEANIWGALLGACRIHGNVELGAWAAEHLFKLKPQHSGYYLLLSNMYAEAGKWDEAKRVRELMKSIGAKKDPGCSWL